MTELSDLRVPLVVHGYDDEGLSTFSAETWPDGARLLTTSGDADRDTLALLFGVGAEVARPAVAGALAPTTLDAWIEHGLLEIRAAATDAAVTAPFRITPHGERHVISDWERGEVAGDVVPGPSATTELLLDALPRTPTGRGLDLGTGPGYVAMEMTRWCDQVTATDLNERAVELARKNAAFNGVEVDVRGGDRFAPVSDEAFDLIACNPPFVISPASELTYRDAPQRGDRFCRDLIGALPDRLTPDGVAVLLASWVDGDDVKAWWSGLPLRGDVVRSQALSPESYARAFARDTGEVAGERRVRQWCAYYRREGIERLHVGVLHLTRIS